MTALGIITLVWTVYCAYAWITHSGIWRETWNLIASHQRGKPDFTTVALIQWAFGLGIVLVVGWPTLRLLRPRTTSG